MKKVLAEAMPLFRSYQKNVKRLVQLRDPGNPRDEPSFPCDIVHFVSNADVTLAADGEDLFSWTSQLRFAPEP